MVRARLSPLEQIHHVTILAQQRPWIDSDHARVVAGRSRGERAWLHWAPAAGVVDAAHEGALVHALAHERGARVSSVWELPRSSVVDVATVAAHGEPRLPKAIIGHLGQICTAVRRRAKVKVDGGKEQDPSTFITRGAVGVNVERRRVVRVEEEGGAVSLPVGAPRAQVCRLAPRHSAAGIRRAVGQRFTRRRV